MSTDYKRFVLRADPLSIGEVAAAYGWPKPERMLRACRAGERASLWLGPDEWLLLGPAGGDSMQLTGPAHSWVEVSDRQVALELTGPLATELLASACPLDLGNEAFAVDDCTRTIFGRCEIVLWRTAEDRFHLECWRSYLPYVQELLQAAR